MGTFRVDSFGCFTSMTALSFRFSFGFYVADADIDCDILPFTVGSQVPRVIEIP